MGLIDKIKGDSAKNDGSQEETLSSTITDTQDVLKELKAFSVSQKIPIERLDFRILKVQTYFKFSKEEEWEEYDKLGIRQLDDNLYFLNPDLRLRQNFKVEIYDKKVRKDLPKLPEISLGANKNLSKVVATIKKSVDVELRESLEKDLYNEVCKKKVRARTLVGIRDSVMKRELKKIASSIRVNKIMDKDATFVAMEGIEPTYPINDSLIMHYKKRVNQEDEQGRMDYSRRGYLLAVEKGEVIIEYIKPQEGMPGKNCRGEYIPVQEPKSDNEVLINTTEAISKKEDDKTIKYVANRSGYVNEDGTNYDIQEQMEINEISFRSTGSIEAGLDKNVKINIKESDVFKDAIGEGMSVETSELRVEGNIGSNASIKVQTLEIGGQTHKNSNIEADTATVTVHRGKIVAKEVTIERLEGGTVYADVVHVKSVIGGEIVAKEIHIEELASNAQLTTSNLIDIERITGQNNKILVDPGQIKGFQETIKNLKKNIADTKKDLENLPPKLENKRSLINRNRQSVDMIKERITQLKKDGVKPPVTFMGKLKEFQQLVNEYNALLSEIKEKNLSLENSREELNQHQNKMFEAKIICHSSWTEFNEIKFRLISPPIDIVYNTKDHELAKVITLQQITDEKFEVKRSNEID